MASTTEPRIYTYISDSATIAKGSAVKIGTDNKHVAIGAANTDKCFGIAQNAITAIGQMVEVAEIGGGAKAKLGEGVSAGAYLVSHTDGTLVKANTAGDHVCAFAKEDGSTSDLIAVEVVAFEAYNAE